MHAAISYCITELLHYYPAQEEDSKSHIMYGIILCVLTCVVQLVKEVSHQPDVSYYPLTYTCHTAHYYTSHQLCMC